MLLSSCGEEAKVEQTGSGGGNLGVDAIISLSAPSETIVEGVPIAFTIELSEPSDQIITVEYSTIDNTATGTADYIISTGQLTFEPGETSKIVVVNTNDDVDPEAPEEFIFALSSALGGSLGPIKSLNLGILDNDTIPQLSISDITSVEGAPANAVVSIDVPSGLAVSFDWTTSDNTATNGNDYSTSAGVAVNIPAGQTSVTINIPTIDDALDEDSETYDITISNINNAAGLDVNGVGTITDNDIAPTINIDSVSAVEGSTLVFTVTASTVSSKTMSTDWTTVDGNATSAGGDYSTATGTLSIPAGQTTGTITLSTLENTAYELAETMTVNLSNNVNSVIGTGIGTGTINDNDTAPSISINDVVVTEGAPANLTVTLSAASEVSTSVNYALSNVTAISPGDYTVLTGTLTIPPASTTGTISVTVIDDILNEASESLSVDLTGAVNSSISDNTGVLTINDNDALPTLSISDETIAEGNNLTFTVSLNTLSGRNVSFDWASSDGVAIAPADYTAGSGTTVTIPAGSLSTTFTVSTTDDALDEADNETINLTLSNPTNATIADANGIGTITDNDAVPSISVNDVTAVEGASLSFTATISAISERNVSFDWTTVDGSATAAGTDYTTASGTITINAGATTGTILVVTNENTAYELNETLSVVFSNPVNGAITDNTGIGTITDNDTAPTIAINDVTVTEGVGAVLTITKTGATEVDLTFNYATADVVATNPSDYTTSTGTGTILAANPTTTVTITTIDDTRDELSETLNTVISSPVNASISDATGVITVLDNDIAPLISISDVALTEGGTAVFTVSLAQASDLNASFDWATADGTATIANTDYTNSSGSGVTIAAGATSITLSVPTNDDAIYEGIEDFSITISNLVNATTGDLTGVATITDNDTAPTLSIDNVSVAEGVGASFTVTLSSAAESNVSFNWATADGTATVAASDYTAGSGTETITAGNTTATINITTLQNTFFEITETFSINLSAPTNATILTGTGVGTITDDDTAPTLAIDSVAVSEAGTATLTVTKTGNTQVDVTVAWTTNAATAANAIDYTAGSGTLTIPSGSSTGTISVVTLGDLLDEFAETLTVDLSAPTDSTISTAQGTITINDDDAAPTLSIDNISIAEGASSQFTVTLSAVSAKAITVDYTTNDGTAVQPGDYTTATATLSIPAGAPSGQFSVVTINEGVNEGVTENFTAVLSSPTNSTIATGTGTATINEVSSAPTLSIDDVSITEGGVATFTVTLSAASLLDVTFDWTSVDATATTAGTDYTANSASGVTITAGATTSTFTVTSLQNTDYEINETFNITLSNASNATIADGTGVGTITDDDPIPTLAIDDVTVTEGVSSVYTVTRTGSTEYNVTVGWSAAAGTATVTNDYTNNTGTLTILPGASTGTISIVTIDDSNDEDDEAFTVTLAGPTNATISTAVGTTTLQDNDSLPQLSISDVTIVEGAVASFTVSQDVLSEKTVNFDWATSDGTATLGDSDYTQVSLTTATIAAGSGSTTVNVTTAVDAQYEGSSENLNVTISNPVEATILDTTGVATLTESTALPAISISDIAVTEGTDTVATFTVSVDHTSDSVMGFTWQTSDGTATTANSDYTGVGATLGTIAAGATSTTVVVNLTDNAFYELTENFTVDLSLPTNATITDAQGVATITDDESVPSIAIDDVTITEGVSADFTVTVTGNTQVDLSFDYVTADGTADNSPQVDFTAFTTTNVVVSAGTPTVTVSIPTNDDSFDEPDSENFTVVISNPSETTISVATGTATLNDNDALPNLSIADVSVNEGATATFTITASAASERVIAFDWTTSDGTAGVGTDYTVSSGVAETIAAYATTTTVTVPIIADTLDELDDAENFNLTLSNLAFSDPAGPSDLAAVGTITDLDVSSFSIDDQSIVEGAIGTFTVSLNVASEYATSVDWATVNATATNPTDYTTAPGTISLAAGVLSDTFTVTTIQNTDYEINETFNITLSAQVNASITDGTSVATITDDDPIPTLAIDDVSATEGGNLTFTITQTNSTEYASTFDWAAVNVTTTAGDYTATPVTVTITPPATTATIVIPTTDDALDESAETFNVNLSTYFQAAAGDGVGLATINDNDNLPNISVADSLGNEGDAYAFIVSIDAVSELPVSVNYTANSGTASSGVDFTVTSGTAVIPAGSLNTTVNVPTTDDVVNCEVAENFFLDLTVPVNGVILDAQGEGTITDNDPLLSIDDPTAAEGATVTFTVSIPGTCGTNITVDYATSDGTATSPTDYTGATGTATIIAGSSTGTFTIPTFDDGSTEGSENFAVALSNLNNGVILDGNSTATITDANPADFSINDVTVSEATGTASFTILLADPPSSTLTVDWTTNDATATLSNDYSSTSGTATFTAGVTTQSVVVTILEDTTNELNETFTVDLSNPSTGLISDAQGIGTINDNDALPTISIAAPTDATEGTVQTFIVNLSAVSGKDVTFDWASSNGTAIAGADYTAGSGTGVTITAGATSANFTVTTLADGGYEGNETYNATISNPGNATIVTASEVGTIIDSITAPTIAIDSVAIAEGGNLVFTVTQSVISAVNTTVDWATSDGTATAPGDYTSGSATLTINAGLTTGTITVVTLDDNDIDTATETMTVTLSNPTSATITTAVGTGSITDDDAIKINSTLAGGGDIQSMKLSNDSSRVLYIADGNSDGVNELYGVNPDGTIPSKINTTPVSGGDVISFKVSDDSSKVVFLADRDLNGTNELYSANLNGSSETKLNTALSAGKNVMAYAITPDSSSVVYIADQTTLGVFEIHSVAIAGGANTVLNSALVGSGDVDPGLIQISANSSKVVFKADGTVDGENDLYSASIGSSGSTKLSTLIAGGSVTNFAISQNSLTVVYIADEALSGVNEIYSIAIGGGTATRINTGALSAGKNIIDFKISGNSSKVVYRGDETTLGDIELYSVNIAGGSQAKLNGALAAGGDVSANYDISLNSSRVIFIADQSTDTINEVYSTPIAGGAATKINAALVSGGNVISFKISPDSSKVVFIADKDVDSSDEIFSAAITGGANTQLNGVLTSGGDVLNFEISANSAKVVYVADQETNFVDELYSVAIGGGTAVKLNADLPTNGSVSSSQFGILSDSSKAIYISDQVSDELFEIFSNSI